MRRVPSDPTVGASFEDPEGRSSVAETWARVNAVDMVKSRKGGAGSSGSKTCAPAAARRSARGAAHRCAIVRDRGSDVADNRMARAWGRAHGVVCAVTVPDHALIAWTVLGGPAGGNGIVEATVPGSSGSRGSDGMAAGSAGRAGMMKTTARSGRAVPRMNNQG